MKVSSYMIVSDFYTEALSQSVTEMIKLDWQPFGSPFCTLDEKDKTFCQAMVVYE